MSTAKTLVIDRINTFSDDIDEMQLIEQLYVATRLEHSKKRCAEEGTITTQALKEHFADKRNAHAKV